MACRARERKQPGGSDQQCALRFALMRQQSQTTGNAAANYKGWDQDGQCIAR